MHGSKWPINSARIVRSDGLRDIHPDAGLHSYNWGAPFRLGFNTLCINGKTCTCLASSHMSLTKLRAARDHVDEIFKELMK